MYRVALVPDTADCLEALRSLKLAGAWPVCLDCAPDCVIVDADDLQDVAAALDDVRKGAPRAGVILLSHRPQDLPASIDGFGVLAAVPKSTPPDALAALLADAAALDSPGVRAASGEIEASLMALRALNAAALAGHATRHQNSPPPPACPGGAGGD